MSVRQLIAWLALGFSLQAPAAVCYRSEVRPGTIDRRARETELLVRVDRDGTHRIAVANANRSFSASGDMDCNGQNPNLCRIGQDGRQAALISREKTLTIRINNGKLATVTDDEGEADLKAVRDTGTRSYPLTETEESACKDLFPDEGETTLNHPDAEPQSPLPDSRR